MPYDLKQNQIRLLQYPGALQNFKLAKQKTRMHENLTRKFSYEGELKL